jgi:SAM-dependent methyltransferase
MLGSHPVLVDFRESVLDEADLVSHGGASQVSRQVESNPALRRLVGRLSAPRSRVSPTSQVLAMLRRRAGPSRVLIIGGGTAGDEVRELYEADDLETVAFDIYRSSLTQFVADGHSIPIVSGTLDAVLILAVLEHVVDPYRVVAEIFRVLRPEGIVLSVMPFMQQVHESAYDFVRLTERGHRWLFRRFDEVHSGVIAGPGVTLAWSIDHFTRALTRSRTIGRAVGLAFFWLPWLERFMSPSFALDGASCLYFIGIRSEESLDMKSLVRGYRGAQGRGRSARTE